MKTLVGLLLLVVLAGCTAQPAPAPGAPPAQEMATCQFVARYYDWFSGITGATTEAMRRASKASALAEAVAEIEAIRAEIQATRVPSTAAMLRRDTLLVAGDALVILRWLQEDGMQVAARARFKTRSDRMLADLDSLAEDAAALHEWCQVTGAE